MSTITRCYSCMATMNGASTCPSCGWQPGNESDSTLYLPQGYVLNNRYLIGKVIGVGGFGIVYVAWDTNLDVRVAVKEFLAKDYAARSSDHVSLVPYTGSAKEEHTLGIEKFIDEAKALAKFQDHPGIVKVNESFKANNTAYMVMQYLDGMTLKEFLKRQPGEKMAFNMAVKAMIPIMDALREVHKAGFVHRDISPDNIFITRQKQIKLLDFGSARYAIGEHSKSLTSVLKHGFAPVEQYSSKGNQGPWSDVYAVAATIYRCVTGTVPPDAMERIQDDSIMSPKQLGIDIPVSGELAIMRGLAIKASARFESIQTFQQALTSGEKPAPTVSAMHDVIQPTRPQPRAIIECPECGAKNQLNPGEDPNALRCGKCKRELGVKAVLPSITEPIETGSEVNRSLSDVPYKRLNSNIYIVGFWGGILSLLMTSSVTSDVVKGFYALVGFAGLCTAGIYSLIILSKGWSILQGTTARMTSGKAVGYMFIPIFNIYWMFIAYKGLADDANKFVDRQPLNKRINPNIALAACIISLIPYFNILAPIFFTILFYQICGFHNEIIDQWEYLSEHPDSDKVGSSNTAVIIIAAVFGSIFIIGILAAIAIPQFSTYRVKGYNAAAISDCKNLKTSLEAYYADHQTYPDDMKRLNYVASKDVEIGYSPNCNSTYNQYTYSAETSCNGYGIAAFHKQGDRIMVANSSKPQIFFKLKSEPDDKYRPL